jgi:hypothetical protein
MTLDYLEPVATGRAYGWAKSLSVVSQLPGRIDGPADTYRQVLVSAELYRKRSFRKTEQPG